jgi:Fe-S-cluster-containing dehydrogenase component
MRPARLGIRSFPETARTVKRLLVDGDSCSGCRACEVACVAWHEGQFGTATARVRVTKIEPLGIDRPHVCRLCRRPPCVAVCPTGALYQDEATGAILLRPEGCTGCADCVGACPFDVVSLHPTTQQALICDLCGGDPACVKRCATGAILYAEARTGPGTDSLRPRDNLAREGNV